MARTESTTRRDGLEAMRDRRRRAKEAWQTAYSESAADIKFVTVPGHQWDEALKQRRRNRPMYEFPKLRMQIQQIINEQKQSRPQGKVRGVEESDRGLAEIMQGICRNIESVSRAERAYDIAYECAVKGGIGWWRVTTDYLNQDDFDLDIVIKPIRNPFCVEMDPAAVEIDRRDAGFCFVHELLAEDTFKREHPDADLSNFFDEDCYKDWHDKGQVRRSEYWWKEPKKRQLLALSDGRVVFADELAKKAGLAEAEVREFLTAAGIQVVRERTVNAHVVKMRLTNGKEWLSEEVEFPCIYIPIVPCWGNIDNIEGEDYFSGAVRFGKDQQRLHNFHRTAATEAVAKAPKAPFIAKKSWLGQHSGQWNNANAEDYPVLYLAEEAPDNVMPRRTNQAEVPAALIQLANMDNEDMKAATGQYDASLGARSNETSGVAINARKMQGATSSFNYLDNLVSGIQYTYEILVDMIPKVIDTPRAVRILGDDGGAKWKQLYQEVQDPQTGATVILNDIRKGKYDVTVTVGPSYATQRMEAVDAFSELAARIGQTMPAMGALLAYKALQNSDLYGGEDVDKAMRKILIQQGMLEPKEDDAPTPPQQPPPPDPKVLADAEKSAAQAALYGAQAEGQQMENMARQAIMQLPPPIPAQPVEQQPPQGGFFTPENTGGFPA